VAGCVKNHPFISSFYRIEKSYLKVLKNKFFIENNCFSLPDMVVFNKKPLKTIKKSDFSNTLTKTLKNL
jgi:hypothetical protein